MKRNQWVWAAGLALMVIVTMGTVACSTATPHNDVDQAGIEANIRAQIATHYPGETFDISIEVAENGTVTLGGKVNDNDKRFHGWGQSESGMIDLLQRCSEPLQTILDPFCGGGATGVAALATGRHFIGADKEAECIETCRSRLVGMSHADVQH